MIPEFFVLVSFFYHFGWVANLIIKRAFYFLHGFMITMQKKESFSLFLFCGHSLLDTGSGTMAILS